MHHRDDQSQSCDPQKVCFVVQRKLLSIFPKILLTRLYQVQNGSVYFFHIYLVAGNHQTFMYLRGTLLPKNYRVRYFYHKKEPAGENVTAYTYFDEYYTGMHTL